MPKRKSNVRPDDILADHNPRVRALAERLRQLVRETIPDATEAAYPGWRAIGYRHPDCGYFCGIFPKADQVNLAFEFGVLLPDPDELLTGAGSQVRYVLIRKDRDMRVGALRKMIKAALDLPPQRDVKLALIKFGAQPVREVAKQTFRANSRNSRQIRRPSWPRPKLLPAQRPAQPPAR